MGILGDYLWAGRFMAAGDRGTPDPERVELCCHVCLNEILPGELYGRDRGRIVCADCADAEWAGLSGREKLELLGFDVERA